MTIDEKRQYLNNYCDAIRDCANCPIGTTYIGHKCGNGKCFIDEDGNHENEVTDNVVKKYYEFLAIDAHDNVEHPGHYETGKFECIEVMQEVMGVDAVKDFCACNAFKYIYRHRRKNGKEDLEKAKWYINKYIELCEESEG